MAYESVNVNSLANSLNEIDNIKLNAKKLQDLLGQMTYEGWGGNTKPKIKSSINKMSKLCDEINDYISKYKQAANYIREYQELDEQNDKNKTTLITIYQIDLGLGTEFNKQYITEIKKFVSNELNELEQIEELSNSLYEEEKEKINSLKEENKLLQSQIEYNNNQIKLLEETKQLRIDNINLRNKKLYKKIESFIGAKIF